MNEAPPVDLVAGEIARARLEDMVAALSPGEAIWLYRTLLELFGQSLPLRGGQDRAAAPQP